MPPRQGQAAKVKRRPRTHTHHGRSSVFPSVSRDSMLRSPHDCGVLADPGNGVKVPNGGKGPFTPRAGIVRSDG
jgi:hypothetical protein